MLPGLIWSISASTCCTCYRMCMHVCSHPQWVLIYPWIEYSSNGQKLWGVLMGLLAEDIPLPEAHYFTLVLSCPAWHCKWWSLCPPILQNGSVPPTMGVPVIEWFISSGCSNGCLSTFHVERLRELGLFSLDKRKLRGNLVNMYKCLMEGIGDEGGRLFSVVPSDRTRENGLKLKPMKFH